MNSLDVIAVVISSSKKHVNRQPRWDVSARIVSPVRGPRAPIETAPWLSVNKLSGTIVNLQYSGLLLKNLNFRPGILFRFAMSSVDVENALAEVAEGREPEITIDSPDIVRPMAEPCVRVPLSILSELRGQEARIEYGRRALVKTWSEDRRTGKASSK